MVLTHTCKVPFAICKAPSPSSLCISSFLFRVRRTVGSQEFDVSLLRAKAPIINPGAPLSGAGLGRLPKGLKGICLTEQTYWVLGGASKETGEGGEGEEGVARSWRAWAPNKNVWT